MRHVRLEHTDIAGFGGEHRCNLPCQTGSWGHYIDGLSSAADTRAEPASASFGPRRHPDMMTQTWSFEDPVRQTQKGYTPLSRLVCPATGQSPLAIPQSIG